MQIGYDGTVDHGIKQRPSHLTCQFFLQNSGARVGQRKVMKKLPLPKTYFTPSLPRSLAPHLRRQCAGKSPQDGPKRVACLTQWLALKHWFEQTQQPWQLKGEKVNERIESTEWTEKAAVMHLVMQSSNYIIPLKSNVERQSSQKGLFHTEKLSKHTYPLKNT